MIKNYFKIAWRNLRKNKLFTAINVSGLALGMATSMLIFMWVKDEMSKDKFHEYDAQLYHIMANSMNEGQVVTFSSGPGILAENLVKDFPEIRKASQTLWEERPLLRVGDVYEKEGGRYVQNDYLSMFSYKLAKGDPKTALSKPDAIVISKKLAEKYFKGVDPIGKSIKIDNKDLVTVTGVLEDIPKESSLKFEFLMSYDYWLKSNEWAKEWTNGGPRCEILVAPNTDIVKLNAKLKDYITTKAEGANREIFLTKYSDTYLYGNWEAGVQDGGRIEYVNIFSIVAIFILLIACINFMNLATAKSVNRAKEIGVRKAGGANKSSLVWQFLSEYLLISFFALLFAIVIVLIALPSFNILTEKELIFDISQPQFLLSLLALTVITGVVSGSYPAFFMSSLNPVVVLKGSLKFKPSATFLRKGLVVFQFGLSIMLILGMLVIYKQINFIQTKNLGFDRENLIYVPLEGDLTSKFPALQASLKNKPGIVSVAASQADPLEVGSNTQGVRWPGKDTTRIMLFNQNPVSYDYLETMGIKLKDGRDFARNFGADSLSYIINEAAAKKIGYKDPVGQELTFWDQKGQIVGVIKDYHFSSIQRAIEPIIIRLLPKDEYWGYVLVRCKAGQTKEALASMETAFKQYNPNYPFKYQFASEEFEEIYRTENTISSLSNYFAFLAIFISCLGLFGLASFTAEQRTKEIGIRKALGASVNGLVAMLSKDFVILVLISTVFAFPVAYYFLRNWLDKYDYRIEIQWWYFAIAVLSAVTIALLTVSYQAIKTALVNPVKSLRSE